MKSIPTV